MIGPDVAHHTTRVDGLKVHHVEAGSGPPVVLLHGFPHTWFAWRHQIAALAPHYRVIAPDLRGYGGTEKPVSGYDKRTMARDVLGLMGHLGIEKAALVGHDRGARVATRFAKDHPGAIDRLVVVDNIPTRIIFGQMDARVARAHWWFLFNNAPDIPEALIQGREEVWLRYILSRWTYDPNLYTPEEFAVYLDAYKQAGALRGAFNDYRAAAEDVEQDEADQDTPIACPTLAVWGEEFEAVGRMWDVRAIWSEMATHAEFFPVPRSSHHPHEERPDLVNAELLRFLGPWKG